jgi:hypothetical protein
MSLSRKLSNELLERSRIIRVLEEKALVRGSSRIGLHPHKCRILLGVYPGINAIVEIQSLWHLTMTENLPVLRRYAVAQTN